jgi:hypothetical protein
VPNNFYESEIAARYQEQESDRLTGPFPAPDFSASGASRDARTARYDVFGCTVDYEYESGLVQLPVAQAPSAGTPKPAAVLGRRNAAVGTKTVRYFAERAGAQPLVPPPSPDDSTQTLLSAKVVPDQPYLEPGAATWIFKVAATYVYALAQPRTYDQGYPVGVPAYSTLTAADTFLPAANFVPGIEGPVPAGPPGSVGAFITGTV